MNVNLTPELEKLVHNKVKAGRYNSASEVVREALRLMEQYDALRTQRLAAFQAELDRRMASFDAGESFDGEEFFAQLAKEEAIVRRKRKRD